MTGQCKGVGAILVGEIIRTARPWEESDPIFWKDH